MEHSVDNPAVEHIPHEVIVHHEITLPQHEAHSERRAARIEHSIHNLKNDLKEDKMTTENVFHHGLQQPVVAHDNGAAMAAVMAASMNNNHRGWGDGISGAGAGGMAGLGGGLLGGILGGALLGGGLLGNRGGAAVDGAAIELGTARVAFDAAAMTTLNNISAAIPANAAAVIDKVTTGQMQLAGQIGEGFANQSTNLLTQTQMLGAQAALNQLMSQQALAGINQNVSQQGSDTRATVTADGSMTRTLITQLNTDNLNRLLTVADLDRRDEAHRGRSREVEVNVSQVVNQAQAQAQQQQQQQQQTVLLNHLFAQFGSLQNAIATNSNLIIGNTGAVATGPQTANPVNVRA